MTSETISAAQADERVADVGIIRRLLRRPEIGALLGALAVYIFFAIVTPENWLTIGGAARFLDPSSTLGIMAVAVALLMIGGEFDLSAGTMTGSSGLIFGMLAVELGMNIWLAMGAALIFALTVGFINGYLVIKTGLPSFIITLGTFFILRGVNIGFTRLITDEVRVAGIDDVAQFELARTIFNIEFQFLGETFRTSILWWIAVTIFATWLLQRTRFGNWIFAVGGNADAARSVGVPADRVKILLFMMVSTAAWMVGIMTALRLRSMVASQGIGQEFIYIISAVIGGCLLTGGYGSAIGASLGALIFGMTRTGIVFAGWDTDWFFAFLGAMLLLAVVVNDYTRKRAEAVGVGAAKAPPPDPEDEKGAET
jgi:simple sugar transport system permease protein